MLPGSVVAHFRNRFHITNVLPVGGGCINDCYRIETSQGAFFLKLNEATAYPGMFAAETEGLKALNNSRTPRIPEVYEQGEVEDISFLLMEYIEPGRANNTTMYQFGAQLAKLHKYTSDDFGWQQDNYIGSLPQKNTLADSWVEFFITMRLQPQLQMAAKAKLLSTEILKQFDMLFLKLPSLFPDDRPSLLHGDLWSGNFLVDTNGDACLVDPAVYYGHREMDIAMSQLFGGFSIEFYEGYEEAYPLEDGWRERVHLCNLYPLLVHVNLFGGSYVAQLKNSLEKFV